MTSSRASAATNSACCCRTSPTRARRPQPRIDIATRQVVGAEALLRWRHPRYGVLAPESFLPLADDTGLLVPIGGWVLREACKQGRRWLDDGISPLSVVVNVSSRQL